MDLYLICRPGAWANMAGIEAAGAKLSKAGNEEDCRDAVIRGPTRQRQAHYLNDATDAK
ncbi:hypothetical protein SAMN04488557_3652 [Hyphomicrobium facile]|uniref:Uncharacterized protein n=1 Tax=Hyphomicrobium facile TaxID=51670 RepID=A0A1I7NUE4_9HYPH|nr:hypothetical protein SAMN04488557_3652 [Hyphomicrobium facile]